MAKIICNGIPKHGTHALLKAVELLGVPVAWGEFPGATLEHRIYDGVPVDGKHIFIIRNPKDAFISWMRHHSIALTEGMILSRLQNMQIDFEGTYFNYCNCFTGWLNDDATLVVRLDELKSDGGATIDRIADYLDVPRQADAFANLPGHTVTWNPISSDHAKYWTDRIEQVWQATRCNELSKALGYDC